MYVQFADATKSTVVSVFGGPQDPEVYQHQGEINADDSRYVDFMESQGLSSAAISLAERDRLLGLAAIRVAPLQDAVDLNKATPAIVGLLRAWKQYRIDLNNIHGQSGYPDEINWPVLPDELG